MPKADVALKPALTPEATWSAAVALLAEEGGGFAAMSAGYVTVSGIEDGVIKGGLPRSREVELHLIHDFKEELERCLRKVSGRDLRVLIELSDDLPDIPEADDDAGLVRRVGRRRRPAVPLRHPTTTTNRTTMTRRRPQARLLERPPPAPRQRRPSRSLNPPRIFTRILS